MIDNDKRINTPSSLVAACGLGVAGVLLFTVLPVLLGFIAESFPVSDEQLGLLGSTYFGAFALTSLTSVAWVRRINWAIGGTVGLTLIIAGLAIIGIGASYQWAMIGMGVSGMGAATAFPLSITLVSDRREKDRDYAIKLIPEQLVPGLLLFVLSTLFAEAIGLKGFLATLAGLLMCILALMPLMPAKGRQVAESSLLSQMSSNIPVLLALLALAFYFLGFSAIWAFLERIGSEGALDPGLVGQLLALGLVSSAVGPFLAALVGDRFGRKLTVTVGVLVALGSLLLLIGELTALRYGALMVLLPLGYYFGTAYFFGIIAEADISGRFASLIPFTLAVGAIVGSGGFGFIKAGLGLNSAYLFCGGSMLMGLLLVLWVDRLNSRITAAEVEALA